jgi:hypothetical protein
MQLKDSLAEDLTFQVDFHLRRSLLYAKVLAVELSD